MAEHPFWVEVEQDWAGFSSSNTFTIPYFENEAVEVFLGEEFNEDGEETDVPPAHEQLDEFATTFSDFLNNFQNLISDLQQKTFDRYNRLYAHYYEDKMQSGAEPLGIDTKEAHFEYMKNIKYIRVTNENTLRLLIAYKLDTEHGLEIKIRDNQIADTGGIAET